MPVKSKPSAPSSASQKGFIKTKTVPTRKYDTNSNSQQTTFENAINTAAGAVIGSILVSSNSV